MQDISIPEMCYSPRPLARLISFCGVDKFLYSHHLNIDYILRMHKGIDHQPPNCIISSILKHFD